MAFDQSKDEAAGAEARAIVTSPWRLAVVHRLGVLDTPVDDVFDSMTQLAITLLRAPTALVSIVDRDRDFYKSQVGLPAAVAAARQMQGETFCHHAIQSPAPLVIADTHATPHWKAVPTVESLGMRAYLGVPMVVDSVPIGSFCVIDVEPHAWTPQDIEMVSQLALSAAREIQLRAALRQSEQRFASVQALAKKNEQWVAMVAHDLRTPLQVIGMSASALTRVGDGATQLHAKRIAGATQSMGRMLTDLIAAHDADGAAPSQRAMISIAKLLTDAHDTMDVIAVRARMTLQVADATDARLELDFAQMLRVLCNLIGNALKYCAAGSTVTLRARVGDGVTIDVADDGPGISQADQARAFEPGWQGDDGRARADGAGLGLSIVRSLVERNGGTVALISQLGSGTTVRLQFAPHQPAVG